MPEFMRAFLATGFAAWMLVAAPGGSAIAAASFLYALFLILRTLLFGVDVAGYASIMVAVLFMGGINLMTLGIIGEYLGRTYTEVKRRPLYIVRDAIGFDDINISTQTDESPWTRKSTSAWPRTKMRIGGS